MVKKIRPHCSGAACHSDGSQVDATVARFHTNRNTPPWLKVCPHTTVAVDLLSHHRGCRSALTPPWLKVCSQTTVAEDLLSHHRG
ncbi:hypothetical protein C0J50_12617 [Silurus asotus]|uniref:Uncharacterized protein n=1 Tax=Silurus asotus TaxID=30991 RepID=A0AAD5FW07_SILAS|nr:hypothetical protein C0J50_12617 [Silurus asotus]